MDERVLFERFITLFQDEIEAKERVKIVRDDIKQLTEDAIERGRSKTEIDQIKRLAKARVNDDDESLVEDARGLIHMAQQLDLFGMGNTVDD